MKQEYLSDWNIVKTGTKTDDIFAEIISQFSTNTDKPSDYVKKLWSAYQALPKEHRTNSMNGSIFEAIIYTVFIKESITPMYFQTELEFVPNIRYDLVVFPKTETGAVDVSAPVMLSLKTSLRESYRKADLEALALKKVYKRALSYLVTLDSEEETKTFEKKIIEKDIRGIDRCIKANTKDFDDMLLELKSRGVSVPPDIKAIKAS